MTDPAKSVSDEGSFDSRRLGNYHEVSFYAVLAGSTSLIPLPFVDDWAHRYVRRLMIRGVLRGETLTPGEENLLVDRSRHLRSERGCLGNALVMFIVTPLRLILYVIGRLFKKIFFVLAIKEATDRAASAFQEGYLLSVSRHTCSLEPRGQFDHSQKVLQLSYALEETMRQTSASPLRRLVRKVFRGSYGLLFQAASRFRKISQRIRDPESVERDQEEEFLEQEERQLEDLVGDLEAALPLERRYLDSIAEQFQAHARRRQILRS